MHGVGIVDDSSLLLGCAHEKPFTWISRAVRSIAHHCRSDSTLYFFRLLADWIFLSLPKKFTENRRIVSSSLTLIFFSSHFSRWSLCEILLLDCMLPQLRVFHASNSHGNSPGNVLFVHLHIYISLCRLPASHIVIALIYRSNIFEASVSHSRSPLRRILRWNEFHLCCCNYFKLSAAQHSKWAWGRAPNEKEIFQHLLFS